MIKPSELQCAAIIIEISHVEGFRYFVLGQRLPMTLILGQQFSAKPDNQFIEARVENTRRRTTTKPDCRTN